jgi:hypothetical protein
VATTTTTVVVAVVVEAVVVVAGLSLTGMNHQERYVKWV